MSQRPETGPMKFGNDWTGVFIRGDAAHNFAVYLDQILDPHREEKLSTTERAVLEGLLSDLQAANEHKGPSPDLQRLQAWEACQPLKTCGGCGQVKGHDGCESSGCTGGRRDGSEVG